MLLLLLIILVGIRLIQLFACASLSIGLEVQRDNGLKLFLEKDDLERLYDFEEECVEGFFHEQEIILNQSTDERVKNTTERVETMSQKIEDINQKENIQTATVQVCTHTRTL